MKKNCFDVLGIPRDSKEKEIKIRYRKLAHKYHPDKGGDAKMFSRINDAYREAIRKDSSKRELNNLIKKNPIVKIIIAICFLFILGIIFSLIKKSQNPKRS